MEKAVDYLVGHPVIFVIAVIIAIMILFSFLRRVLRLFLVIAALLVLYAAYLQLTGGSTHEAFQHIALWFNNIFHFFASLFGHFFNGPKSPKK
ncbi:MAG: hypothetical protein WCL43_07925 [Chlorobium sp.]|jgi:hypothetical protein|nr:MAG: hypothetical protein FDX12_07345 [Chlorobium sp.]